MKVYLKGKKKQNNETEYWTRNARSEAQLKGEQLMGEGNVKPEYQNILKKLINLLGFFFVYLMLVMRKYAQE